MLHFLHMRAKVNLCRAFHCLQAMLAQPEIYYFLLCLASLSEIET